MKKILPFIHFIERHFMAIPIASTFGELPATAYVRQAQLIGQSPVTPEQAEANKQRGKGPRRPRTGMTPIVPWSSATLWRKIKAGKFCAPVKLSERTTAFRVEDVRRWLDAQAAK